MNSLQPFKHLKIIDLTQPLSKNVPTWDGSCGYCSEIKKDYDQLFKVNHIQMDAGIGTHMDAPNHLFKEGQSIDKLDLNKLITKLVILDVTSTVNADYEISREDIEIFEKKYGQIEKDTLVVGFTGWCKFWNDSLAYRNNMRFPAFSKKAAELLIERDVAGIAIDTLSPDCQDSTFPVHKLFLGSGKYIIENIADCSEIPPQGAYVIALPMKLQGCTEAPARIIALIPNSP